MKENQGTKTNGLSNIAGILLLLFVPISLLSTCKPVKPAEIYRTRGAMDICPFGDLRYWSEQTGVLGNILNENDLIEVPNTAENEWNVGFSWNEERDINRIEIVYDGTVPDALLKDTKIQYWFQNWPIKTPKIDPGVKFVKSMVVYDPRDDVWQGKWLTAETDYGKEGNKIIYTFKPVTEKENEHAGNLPEPVTYRRTVKLRMLYNSAPLPIRSLKVLSPTNEKSVSVRIELGRGNVEGKNMEGTLEIFNGRIDKVRGWNLDGKDKLTSNDSWNILLGKKSKGIIADLIVAEPTLPGSNDLSVVTVRSSQGTFSFLVKDLEKGPIYIPTYSAYITYASDKTLFAEADIIKGNTVREKLAEEPEQTYVRASREIPKLNVMLRRGGGKLYLPLAADASWQKFCLEWGGGFFMNKHRTKAKGKELERCNWRNDELHWLIGTGEEPVYVRDDKTSHMSILDDYLPVSHVTWNQEGLIYREEGFATLLEGPLSPNDELRNEQTPAILMIKLEVENPTLEEKTAHIWLKPDSLENPFLRDLFIMDKIDDQDYIRLKIKLPEGGSSDIKMVNGTFDIPFTIPANQSVSLYLSVPFVGDLIQSSREKISSLDYDTQRQRVVSYWRNIVDGLVPFNVPERKFNEMARAVIPHIRISTTKDPKSGLFMVPAGSFDYQVYANEASFQTIFLDKIGDHQTSADYLETLLELQGSSPMPGTFTGDQSAVFHGAKVNDEYDYTSSGYNLDHGTVLWALAEHYLLSGDDDWLRHAAPNMLKAAEWIVEQRSQTKIKDKKGKPVIYYGLLPAGQLEDNSDWGFWYAVNAYAWLGMQTMAEAFKTAGLPEGERLEKEAASYLSDLRASVKQASELAPVVRLRNNIYVPYVPSRANQRLRHFGPLVENYYSRYGKTVPGISYKLSACREALYGPLILISTGIISPHDALAGAILDDWEDNITLTSSLGLHVHGAVDDEYWFSRGGMVFQPNLQNPIQAYLLRNEIPAAIRSVYNSMVSCLYPDVNAFTEEYHRWGIGSGPFYKIPDESRFVTRTMDMLVMEAGNELWLAPGTPRYWLEPGKAVELYHAAIKFGDVSYELKNGAEPNTIEADINLPTFSSVVPDKILLFVRAPFEKPIKSVTVNGKDWKDWDQIKDAVVLPADANKLKVVLNY